MLDWAARELAVHAGALDILIGGTFGDNAHAERFRRKVLEQARAEIEREEAKTDGR